MSTLSKFIALLVCFFALMMFVSTADAARFGGGRSFGMQRSMSGFSHQRQAPPISQRSPQRSSWMAPLAGLALGSMLGYLLMGHGLGSGLFSWIILLGLGFLIIQFVRSKLQPAYQTAQPYGQPKGRIIEGQAYFTQQNDYATHQHAYPNFDRDTFLREAKGQFIRLQAAYDQKDLKDLREFTAPEVYAEIQLQLQERGEAMNETEVVSLDAQVTDVTMENQEPLVTVKFTGLIRENRANPASFEEAWHFRKDPRQKWIVAGVQQV